MPTPPFSNKAIAIKECRRCRSTWCGDRVALEPHDKVEIIKVGIAYCPACAESFAEEIDRPTYRRAGKRIQ